MSHTKPLSRVSQQNNISLDLAIAAFSNAEVEEISEVLRKVPLSVTAKIVIAIGKVCQESA